MKTVFLYHLYSWQLNVLLDSIFIDFIIFTTGRTNVTKKQEISRNEKIKKNVTEQDAHKTLSTEVKKNNVKTAEKKLRKETIVKEEVEKDNQPEGKLQRKRKRKVSGSPTPDDNQPLVSNGRGRGKKVTRKDTGEPNEDVKPIKREVKAETDKPTKKKKKGEVGIDFEASIYIPPGHKPPDHNR